MPSPDLSSIIQHRQTLLACLEQGRIRDPANGNTFSVKMQFNSEEQWTKAMKYMLTNLKWGLAWVTSKYTNKE